MDLVKCFSQLFESIPVYWEIVLLRFLKRNDEWCWILKRVWIKKTDDKRHWVESEKILKDLNEDFLDYKKKEEESLLENIRNKWEWIHSLGFFSTQKMEKSFATLFEDVRHERSLIFYSH